MIPIKLSMRNFMCYRDDVPPLHFGGIHTVCISGDNGNGKSALIDAMTWALWGRTRARSDDDLVYSGQTEMEVEFDFAVGQQPYRIIRKHARPKKSGASGRSILEFQIATGQGFEPLTADSISQTQRKINDVLHVDYLTFINSALLLQGRADEFTVRRPVERKEVLADILGLAFYDRLEVRAKELARQQTLEKTQLEAAIQDINEELAQKPACEVELEQAQAELSRLEQTVKEQESRLNGLRKQKDVLESQKLELAGLEERIGSIQQDLGRWDDQVRQHQHRINEYQELIDRRSVIEEGYAQYLEAKKLNDELDQKFRQLAALNERKHRLEVTVMHAGEELVREHAVAQSRVKELEASYQKLPRLKNELQQVQAALRQLSEREEALRTRRQAGEELRAWLSRLESTIAQLEQERAGIEEKLKMLLTHGEARCPLCETELGAEGIKLIETKYAAERDQKSDYLRANRLELAQKKAGAASLENEILKLEAGLSQDRASAQGQSSILGKAVADANEAGNQLAGEKERLAEIEQRLAGREFAIREQEALRQIEDELVRLDYAPQRHAELRQRLDALQQYENPKRRLEEADRLIDREREAASRAEEAYRQWRHHLEVDSQKRQELTARLGVLPQLISDLARAETEYQALTGEQKRARDTVWSVRARLGRCAELEVKKTEKEKLLAQAARQETVFKDLAQAFGKKGIQALLIEMALPEIETEANRLLARMTDNRMHVKLETQRPTRKGDLAETLDINISDELGTRNYEMFSGGETFRINFAIRIALSKLLARRAGAPLPTLVIDEGFGTQDSAGLEKLKEAINSIQDDFNKIIVITHLDELKDAFPTRINVVKTPRGSTLSVS